MFVCDYGRFGECAPINSYCSVFLHQSLYVSIIGLLSVHQLNSWCSVFLHQCLYANMGGLVSVHQLNAWCTLYLHQCLYVTIGGLVSLHQSNSWCIVFLHQSLYVYMIGLVSMHQINSWCSAFYTSLYMWIWEVWWVCTKKTHDVVRFTPVSVCVNDRFGEYAPIKRMV